MAGQGRIERYTTEIRAFTVQALDSRPADGGFAPAGQYHQPAGEMGGGYAEEDFGSPFPSEASGMDDAPF